LAPAYIVYNAAMLFAGRRGRHLREYATAYLMIAPAIALIFLFGIFPIGLENYVAAVANLSYIVMFALGVGALAGAWRLARQLRRDASGQPPSIWLLALPAALHAAVVFAFFRWLFFQLPEFLEIANKMRGLERTRALFARLLSEAFFAESVYPYWQQFAALLLAALGAGLLAAWLVRVAGNAEWQARFTLAWLALTAGVGLLAATTWPPRPLTPPRSKPAPTPASGRSSSASCRGCCCCWRPGGCGAARRPRPARAASSCASSAPWP
jgi:hypothetical protein